MNPIKSFKEIALQEKLAYTVSNKEFEKILKDNEYSKISKGGEHEDIKKYSDGKEELFSYNDTNNKLVINKQGWQLINVKRGY